MARVLFDQALQAVRDFYQSSPELSAFQRFPDQSDFHWQELRPNSVKPADLLAHDESLYSGRLSGVRDALLAVSNVADWREHYQGTDVSNDFRNRFGSFELFGLTGHFHCRETCGFVVYAASDLYYPWHHHPAEEMYFILAGEAEFATEGSPPKLLGPGDSVFHESNQPHNMRTGDKGVLAWVQWRGEMETAPVWTEQPNNAVAA